MWGPVQLHVSGAPPASEVVRTALHNLHLSLSADWDPGLGTEAHASHFITVVFNSDFFLKAFSNNI